MEDLKQDLKTLLHMQGDLCVLSLVPRAGAGWKGRLCTFFLLSRPLKIPWQLFLLLTDVRSCAKHSVPLYVFLIDEQLSSSMYFYSPSLSPYAPCERYKLKFGKSGPFYLLRSGEFTFRNRLARKGMFPSFLSTPTPLPSYQN